MLKKQYLSIVVLLALSLLCACGGKRENNQEIYPSNNCDPAANSCGQNKVCNPTTKKCEPISPSADCDPTTDSCGQNKVCNPTTKKCTDPPSPGTCDPINAPCAPSQFCNTTTHTCESAPDCSLVAPKKSCPNGLICEKGKCSPPIPCSNSTCPSDRTCVDGQCIKGKQCYNSNECAVGTERCHKGICINITGTTDLCANGVIKCGPQETCEDNSCKTTCNSPCGAVCCGSGEVCYKDTCVAPCAADTVRCGPSTSSICCGGNDSHGNPLACIDNKCIPTSTYTCNNIDTFCPITRYCANFQNASGTTENKCVKFDDNPGLCLLPTVDTFALVEKLHYDNPTHLPAYHKSVTVALVADVTGGSAHQPNGIPDGKPDIIVNTYKDYYPKTKNAVLRIISGTAGPKGPTDVTEYWESTKHDPPTGDEFFVNLEHTPAIGDLDGDGHPDIVAVKQDKNIIAIKGDGTKIWNTSTHDSASFFPHELYKKESWKSISIADLDHDGTPEVLFANSVINGKTGQILCNNLEHNLTLIAADLDETGNMEIISGSKIYSYDPNTSPKCTLKTTLGPYKTTPPTSALSFSAVADIFPEIPGPEIAFIHGNKLYVLDSHGGSIVEPPFTLPGATAGPPTLGDFDGDERLEIAFADKTAYVIVKPEYNPNTQKATLQELWKKQTHDESSGITGSSIFDFDGDGKAEALYFDENYLRIYNGKDGATKAEIVNSSVTDIEYPLVVDVDADGHADIVTVGNYNSILPPGKTYGVRVFTDAKNRWVPTRKIWNQHTYHYTNVNDDGTIPRNEKPHWKQPWSNTFRQNVQQDNNRLAPDLTGQFDSIYNDKNCNDQSTRPITYSIRNDGSKVVPAGKVVAVVQVREAGTGTYKKVHSFTSTKDLVPGTKITDTFTFDASANSLAGKPLDLKLIINPDNNVIECKNDNNIIEKKNTPLTPPNLLINQLPGSLFCNGSGSNKTANITFELFNNGQTTIPANSVETEVVVTVNGSTQEFTQRVKNLTTIGPNLAEQITVSIPLGSAPDSKPLDVKIVIDPDNNINECNENDNELSVSGALICYALG